MITQTAGMNTGWHEVMAEGIHFRDRRHLRRITIIESINTLGQGRATCRFYRQKTDIFAVCFIGDKGEGNARKVGTTAMATDDHIGVITGNLELLLRFEANNRLMHADMIQHAAQSSNGYPHGSRHLPPLH